MCRNTYSRDLFDANPRNQQQTSTSPAAKDRSSWKPSWQLIMAQIVRHAATCPDTSTRTRNIAARESTCWSRGLSQEEGEVPSLEGVELMAVLLGDANRLAAQALPSGCPPLPPRPEGPGMPTNGASPACDGDATCLPAPSTCSGQFVLQLCLSQPPYRLPTCLTYMDNGFSPSAGICNCSKYRRRISPLAGLQTVQSITAEHI